MVVPYASFLQKMANSTTNIMSASDLTKIKKEDVWKTINEFKALIKVSNTIVLVLRYYMQEYMELVICLIKVFDFDIKMKYPIIEGYLTTVLTEL